MPDPIPRPIPRAREAGEFEHRFTIWAELQRNFGSARSYPYAWRLPELARREGADARARADLALAQTLFAMGRFGDVLAALPDAGRPVASHLAAQALHLRACCHALRDETEAALECHRAALAAFADPLEAARARVDFLFWADRPEAAPAAAGEYQARAGAAARPEHVAWARLFADWAEAGRAAPARTHAALAWLRTRGAAEAALAESCHAEARFHEAPATALAWLDVALEQADRYGWHHIKTRLLWHKALALEAAGQLGEAGRFGQLARETARRQGAWRDLSRMAV